MKIFDIHVHIYPDKIAEKASRSIGEFYDGFPIQGDGRLESCLKRMDAAGICRFAAHSVALTPHNVEKVNAFILQAYRQAPDRIVPFATIHPDLENIPEFVDTIVEQGFRGIKIHPDMQKFALDDPRVLPMMRAISGRLPLLIHCGDSRHDYDGPHRVLSLRDKLPDLQMICAHFGGWMEWDFAAETLPGHGLTVDLSSALFQWTSERAAQVIRSFGVENVLYGTDYPMWDPAEEVERFMRTPLSQAEREDICWNNAARILHLED